MLQAGLGVLAALALVLALGALCVWLLKRFGAGTLLPRTRVPVEVVQRIALGPKVGLAVVRVGEKVMALSIGEGGVRTLFELDEADRQQILASSTLATPHASSRSASDAFAKFLPSKFALAFGRAPALPLPTTLEEMTPVAATPIVGAPTVSMPYPVTQFSPTMAVTYSRTLSPEMARDRDFRAMLGVSLSAATRLVVLIAALAIAGATAAPLRAQTPPVEQPPVKPPVADPTPAPTPAQTPTPAPVVQVPVVQAPVAPTPIAPTPAAPSATPVATPLPSAAGTTARTPAARSTTTQTAVAQQPKGPAPLVAPQIRGRKESPRTEAAKATLLSSPAAQAKGNGSSVSADGARVTKPTSAMKVESAARDSNKAQAEPAAVAPIAGEDAIMKMMPQMDMKIGDAKDGGLRLNGTVGIVVMMGLLTLLPTLLLMMTGFTRILIVLHFLKQAMGTQGAPPAQLLAGLALLLTGFVMSPTLVQVNRDAITPWLDGKMTQVQMMQTGVKPMREFMLRQTRQSDLKAFVELSRMPRPNTVDDVPLHVLMSAFVASELRTSFQIGFMIYLPFIIIDAVVASVLMSMGMMMLPPAMISLPFKLLLFVLVDGWTLTIQSLVQSFK